MVRIKKQKISSNEIAELNYSVTLLPRHKKEVFEELWSLNFFQQFAAFPFSTINSATKKTVTASNIVKELIQLEDSDFPPKKERQSIFSEPVYDAYLKHFLKQIGDTEMMELVTTLSQHDYLTKGKKDGEFLFLSSNIRKELSDRGTKLDELESQLTNILGYQYDKGTQKRKEKDNELLDAIDASKPVLFPDILEKNITVNQSNDEIKVSIDTEKYFQQLFKDYGFGDIDGFEDDVPLKDKDGEPIIDKETGKQKTGRRFTGNFQYNIAELPKGFSLDDEDKERKPKPSVEETSEDAYGTMAQRAKEEELREEFENEHFNESEFETDTPKFLDGDGNPTNDESDSEGKSNEDNPEWIQEYDEWFEEEFQNWKEDWEEEQEEDLEQYDEDDEYETSGEETSDEFISDNPEGLEEKMLKAIEIAKAIFKPTQDKKINHILKITPKKQKKHKKKLGYYVEDWDGTHAYDTIEDAHDALQEIEFDEDALRKWIMKLIQDQRKSPLKTLILDALTYENNLLYLGTIDFTLVRYEYDTVDELQLALDDSLDPEASEDFADAKTLVLNQIIILQRTIEEIGNIIGDKIIQDIFKTKKQTSIISELEELEDKINRELEILDSWIERKGERYREITSLVGQGGELEQLYFDMEDPENIKFKDAAEDPETELPLLPESNRYGNLEWVQEQHMEPVTSEDSFSPAHQKDMVQDKQEFVMPKLSNGQNRYQQIENRSKTWKSEILDSNKMNQIEQKETLEDLLILVSNAEGKRKDKGLLDIMRQKTLKGGRLNIEIDIIDLWLSHIKGQKVSFILDEDNEELQEAVAQQLRETSWKTKSTQEGEVGGGAIHLPIVAYKKHNKNLNIKIDTKPYRMRWQFGDKWKKRTRFGEERMGSPSKRISQKDMNELKKIIREFDRMQSMVN